VSCPDGYVIERALPQDSTEIRNFFDRQWKKDHILARDENFFTYEMTTDGVPNILVARWEGEIIALVGFFAPGGEIGTSDLVIATLRVREAHTKANLSVVLIQRLQSMTCGQIHCIGIIPKALPLYQLLGFRTGWMDHTWWPNPSVPRRRISVATKRRSVPSGRSDAIVRPVKQLDDARLSWIDDEGQIAKSRAFLERRYFRHPIYRYTVILVRNTIGEERGLGVLRRAEADDAAALRIVDWLGDPAWFPAFAAEAVRLCQETAAEFVDCYSAGLDAAILSASGLLPPGDGEIAPNYFSPFEMRNVALTYSSTGAPSVRLFRGDGDQDRPS